MDVPVQGQASQGKLYDMLGRVAKGAPTTETPARERWADSRQDVPWSESAEVGRAHLYGRERRETRLRHRDGSG